MNKFLYLDENVFKADMRVVVNCSNITAVECQDDTITFVVSHGNKYSFKIRKIFPIISDPEVRYITKETFCDFKRFWYSKWNDDCQKDCIEFVLYLRLKKALDDAIMLSVRSRERVSLRK